MSKITFNPYKLSSTTDRFIVKGLQGLPWMAIILSLTNRRIRARVPELNFKVYW